MCLDRVAGDGKLQIEELVKNIDVLNEHSVNGEQLKEAFLAFDTNKDGYIRSVRYDLSEYTHVDKLKAKLGTWILLSK